MYAQITQEERYDIAAMRRQRISIRGIAHELGRSPSTISREIRRNRKADGGYRAYTAGEHTRARRRTSRRNARFKPEDYRIVDQLLGLDWSPEQVSGWLKMQGLLSISHETIYLHVWQDQRCGGDLWSHLRQATKKRRKRNGSHDSRGRLAGKRHISERPAEVEDRRVPGHWEIDTIMGDDHGRHSALTVVERVTGYLLMGKLEHHCAADAAAKAIELIDRQHGCFKTITADNGTEFHSYADIEAATGVEFYFAPPTTRGSGAPTRTRTG